MRSKDVAVEGTETNFYTAEEVKKYLDISNNIVYLHTQFPQGAVYKKTINAAKSAIEKSKEIPEELKTPRFEGIVKGLEWITKGMPYNTKSD